MTLTLLAPDATVCLFAIIQRRFSGLLKVRAKLRQFTKRYREQNYISKGDPLICRSAAGRVFAASTRRSSDSG
jgi:hypothetical protein